MGKKSYKSNMIKKIPQHNKFAAGFGCDFAISPVDCQTFDKSD